MIKRLKKIETELMSIYYEFKEQSPNLHNLSFEISSNHLGGTEIHGYYHIGHECKHYDSIEELAVIVAEIKGKIVRNEILYWNFKGML